MSFLCILCLEEAILLRYEIQKIVNRKQFYLVLFILFIAVVADFLVTCKCYYGAELLYVRSAYRCTIIKNDIGLISSQCFSTLLPILVCMVASDIYYEEYTLGITNCLYTRCKKQKNIRCKVVAIMLVVFLMSLGMLLFSLGLCSATFPIQGHYSSNTTYLTITTPEQNRILSWFEAFHPYWNLVIFMIIRSCIAALLAAFAFTVSLFQKFNRYIVLLSGFLYFILYTNITVIFENEFMNTDVMGINTYGSIWAILLFCLITFLFVLIFSWAGARKETY